MVDVAPLTIEALELESLAELEPLHADDIRVMEIGSQEIKEPR
jgi:hypothetical protein